MQKSFQETGTNFSNYQKVPNAGSLYQTTAWHFWKNILNIEKESHIITFESYKKKKKASEEWIEISLLDKISSTMIMKLLIKTQSCCLNLIIQRNDTDKYKGNTEVKFWNKAAGPQFYKNETKKNRGHNFEKLGKPQQSNPTWKQVLWGANQRLLFGFSLAAKG